MSDYDDYCSAFVRNIPNNVWSKFWGFFYCEIILSSNQKNGVILKLILDYNVKPTLYGIDDAHNTIC